MTGAVSVALGPKAAGIFSCSDNLFKQLEQSAFKTAEYIWRLPIWDEYLALLDSNIADIKNSGSGSAGSCTAAVFLKQFVKTEAVQWAHLDIGGVMEHKTSTTYHTKGMSGFSSRLLVDFIENYSKE